MAHGLEKGLAMMDQLGESGESWRATIFIIRRELNCCGACKETASRRQPIDEPWL